MGRQPGTDGLAGERAVVAALHGRAQNTQSHRESEREGGGGVRPMGDEGVARSGGATRGVCPRLPRTMDRERARASRWLTNTLAGWLAGWRTVCARRVLPPHSQKPERPAGTSTLHSRSALASRGPCGSQFSVCRCDTTGAATIRRGGSCSPWHTAAHWRHTAAHSGPEPTTIDVVTGVGHAPTDDIGYRKSEIGNRAHPAHTREHRCVIQHDRLVLLPCRLQPPPLGRLRLRQRRRQPCLRRRRLRLGGFRRRLVLRDRLACYVRPILLAISRRRRGRRLAGRVTRLFLRALLAVHRGASRRLVLAEELSHASAHRRGAQLRGFGLEAHLLPPRSPELRRVELLEVEGVHGLPEAPLRQLREPELLDAPCQSTATATATLMGTQPPTNNQPAPDRGSTHTPECTRAQPTLPSPTQLFQIHTCIIIDI
jgi:hypothetical protein